MAVSGLQKPDAARSALMGRVRQRDTRPEQAVALALRSLGIAYRKNVRSLPGSPDFANKSRKWAVFVHGCFWHRHTGCRRATTPKANRDFWLAKFATNRTRDARAIRALRAMGFRVAIIWECSVADAERRLSEVLEPRGVDVGGAVDH
jgi:DNA mismatch endonuclease (patch repair protein)